MREALAKSRNLVSIRLLRDIGVDRALAHIAKFGFDIDDLPHNLSLSLGTGEVTPMDLARAYAVFANGGFLVEPYFIQRIEQGIDGEVLYLAEPAMACADCLTPPDAPEAAGARVDDTEPAFIEDLLPAAAGTPVAGEDADSPPLAARTLNPGNAWIMSSMLRDVIRLGTGRKARSLGRDDLAGKTGTTNDQNDAWFSGFNRSLVTTVWVGFDQLRPLGRRETGAQAALPMWIDYMAAALEDVPESATAQPAEVVALRIDPDTGRPTTASNPDAVFEYFLPDQVPPPQAGDQSSNTGTIRTEQIF